MAFQLILFPGLTVTFAISSIDSYLLLSQVFKFVSVTFAVAAVCTGVQALFGPVSFSQSFGLPLEEPKPDREDAKSKPESAATASQHDFAVSYVSLMGVRQLATGVILLTFAHQRKWEEIATILAIIGLLVAGIDGFYLARAGKRNAAIFHAVPGALIALLARAVISTGMIRTSGDAL